MLKPGGLEIRYRLMGSPTRVVTYSAWRLRGLATVTCSILVFALYQTTLNSPSVDLQNTVTLLSRDPHSITEQVITDTNSVVIESAPQGLTGQTDSNSAPSLEMPTPLSQVTDQPNETQLESSDSSTPDKSLENASGDNSIETSPAATLPSATSNDTSEHLVISLDYSKFTRSGDQIVATFGIRNMTKQRISGSLLFSVGSSDPSELSFGMRTFVEKTFNFNVLTLSSSESSIPIQVIAKLEDGQELLIFDGSVPIGSETNTEEQLGGAQ